MVTTTIQVSKKTHEVLTSLKDELLKENPSFEDVIIHLINEHTKRG